MAIDVRGMAPLLQVFDMPVSLAFYQDVLGFELVNSSGPPPNCEWALLRLNSVEVMLNTAYESHARPAAADPDRCASHADTTLYFGVEDLDGAYQHFRDRNINIEKPVVRPYGMRQLSVTDPDGYGLCFQWPADENSRSQRKH